MSARIDLLVTLGLGLFACTAPAATPAPAPAPAKAEPASTPPPPPLPPAAEDATLAARLAEANTPPELLERGAAAKIWGDHAVDRGINPFYLRGDFDGDAAPDYLVSVVPKLGGGALPRLVVLRGGGRPAVWLDDDPGAGLTLPARDAWYVHDRGTSVPAGPGGKAPALKGDGIVMMKLESSSALVYWDGSRFRSHWLSD
ncbi:hypothetical protein [Nannocystis pusilla]|uniref:Uncharacterized protein n=1 Tax=Nannocystis pusilla TaxID=889268 RepID=A0ABS7TLE8_9BACT|nr:hypothetical protein [Nannocystis pusilla]MBZ5708916.1 hypothetical protein [Nannocystis pusilla]